MQPTLTPFEIADLSQGMVTPTTVTFALSCGLLRGRYDTATGWTVLESDAHDWLRARGNNGTEATKRPTLPIGLRAFIRRYK